MEEIYANIEPDKPASPKRSTNPTGPRSSKRSFHTVVILCLGLLSVFLLAGLITLGLIYRDSAADLSAMKENLTEPLQTSNDELSSMTEERDQLRVNLTGMTAERDRLHSWSEQYKTCPSEWTMFSYTCYLLSQETGSWDEARKDCQGRGADLVVVNSAEEQTFISTFTKKQTWIGLNDRETEGTWKWVDGTPLTLKFWGKNQPDNKGGQYGEEDCVNILKEEKARWNDLPCVLPLQWICEKLP